MNFVDPVLQQISKMTPADVMLADVAVRIQLSPTDYQRAVQRYKSMNEWLDREDSALHGLVENFYAQGGFAIGATTARHSHDEDFDIDAMAQLALSPKVDPETALALLHKSIKGEKGSRYYHMAERKTRCSTVNYTGMHLDVTPCVRIAGLSEKSSFIFHSKPENPHEPKLTLFANPYGFAEWFKTMTPTDTAFGQFFESRSLDYERGRMSLLAEDAEPVPDQLPAYRKSVAVIGLQLRKRWRCLAYDKRHPKLRRPPSVLLSYYTAANANRTQSLTDELIYQSECLISDLENAGARGRTIHIVNPACSQDILTDRWPANVAEQQTFVNELRGFVAAMRKLKQGLSLPDMQRVLEELFGERAGRDAVNKYINQHAEDRSAGRGFHIPKIGAVPAAGAAFMTSRTARATPGNTFFGE